MDDNIRLTEKEVKIQPRPVSEMPHTVVLATRFLKKQRASALAFNTIPFLGTIIALVLASKFGIDVISLNIFLVMLAITLIGIEVGYHRFFSHNSFKATVPVILFLGIAGSMSVQASISYWVSNHRRHHADTEGSLDPHSPYHYGDGFFRRLCGIWHSHIGWIFGPERTCMGRYSPDILENEIVSYIDRHYLKWVFLGVVLPALLGGMLHWSLYGILTGFLWGGFVRIFVCHHLTYSVNSLCHLVGSKQFKSNDRSTNINLLSIFNFGGALHNVHHAFPNSAINGLMWWQVDPGAWFIRSLEWMGWIWDVKKPSSKMIEAKLIL